MILVLVYQSHVNLHSKGAVFISYCQQFLNGIEGEGGWIVRKAMAECLWREKKERSKESTFRVYIYPAGGRR